MSLYQTAIEKKYLKEGLEAIRASAGGKNLHDYIDDYQPQRALSIIDIGDELQFNQRFSDMIYTNHKSFRSAVKKAEITAFSWSYDKKSKSYDERTINDYKEIDQLWNFARNRQTDKVAEFNEVTFFLPNIGVPSTKDREVKHALLEISEIMCKLTPKQKNEFVWQTRLAHPISGFGVDGSQLYIKSGLTVTLFHDELGWSSAVNYMTHASKGVAIWIGVNLKEMEQHFTKEEIIAWYTNYDVNKWLISLAQLRNRLAAEHRPVPEISIVFQQPGTMIYSPPGCAHLVLTCSDLVEQVALNYSASEESIRDCLDYWKAHVKKGIEYNSGMATTHVVPLLQLAYGGLNMGNEVAIELTNILGAVADANMEDIEFVHAMDDPYLECGVCKKPCLFVLVRKQCESCI